MILSIYSVRDELVGFMTPTLEQNDATAMRNFLMACDSAKRDSSLMAFAPSHYTLFKIGSFDSSTGQIFPVTPIENVCSGASNFKEVFNVK